MRPANVRSGFVVAMLACVAIAGAIMLWAALRSRAATPANLLAQAGQAYGREDWAAAEKGARDLLKSHDERPETLRLLARSMFQQGRDEPAMALCERLGESRLEAEDLFLLGHAVLRSGKKEAAIILWRKALGKDADHVKTWVALHQIFFELDLPSEAARAAERITSLPGWEARGLLMLGRSKVAIGDPAAAARAYQLALDKIGEWHQTEDPDKIRKLLARLYLRTGQSTLARGQLKLLTTAGQDDEALWLISRCDLEEGQKSDTATADAARAYRRAHPVEPEPAAFVGEAKCAACHESIFRTQHASRHARTFPRGDQLKSLPYPRGPIADPGNKAVSHEFLVTPSQTQIKTTAAGQVFETIVDYAFGSGDRGLTLVGHGKDGRSFEYRLSYYAAPVGWDVTSGHTIDEALPAQYYQGMYLNADAVWRCLACHATHPQSVLTATGPAAADRAIGCELCHGPGENHLKIAATLTDERNRDGHRDGAAAVAAAADRDMAIARPALASGADIVRLCGQCHSPRDRRLQLSPGSPDSVRFQGTTFTWSRCYTESGQKLDCATCHDPHVNVVTTPEFYESRCLECHGEKPATAAQAGAVAPERFASTTCPVEPARQCLDCHMPKVQTPMAHARFTDHFIRVHRDQQAAGNHEEKPAR